MAGLRSLWRLPGMCTVPLGIHPLFGAVYLCGHVSAYIDNLPLCKPQGAAPSAFKAHSANWPDQADWMFSLLDLPKVPVSFIPGCISSNTSILSLAAPKPWEAYRNTPSVSCPPSELCFPDWCNTLILVAHPSPTAASQPLAPFLSQLPVPIPGLLYSLRRQTDLLCALYST